MSNPLLEKSKHPHGAFAFDKIKAEHFIPALKAAIETARQKLELYKKDNSTNFHDVLVKLDDVTEQVYGIYGIFENLHSAECPEELDKVSEEISSLVTSFSNDIGLDPDIFRRIKSCYETRAEQILTHEEKKILEKTFIDFKRNGALGPVIS
jgi:peptidyl-dipeptidase Dcp